MPAMWLDVDVALAEVPVNFTALIDDTDFKTREESVVYNQAGMDLVWNFVTSAGVYTQTVVTPTEYGGNYDWNNRGKGMYAIKIPASAGASINNDREGYGWFVGYATGILPWSGPVIGFRAAGLNDKLTDSAYNATRGLAGTALPDAVADAVGGLPISDAGGLDIDAIATNAARLTAVRAAVLTDWINDGRLDNLLDAIPTTAMRGTDNAALASVVGALADVAAVGDVTEADTLMQYLKQLINILIGTPGIAAFPAETGPGNGVSLAEVIRAMHVDVTGLNGSAMVGTDGANTVVPDAAGVVPTAVEIQAEMEENGASILDTLRDDLADGGRLDELIDAIKAVTDLLAAAAGTMMTGTVSHDNTPASTTAFYSDDITEAIPDHYNGRIVIFTSGALQYQATDITDYELSAGEGKFTVTALTEAPADNVTFVIV